MDDKFPFESGYCVGPRGEAFWPVMFEGRNLCKVVDRDPKKRGPAGWLQDPDRPSFIAIADQFTRLYASFIEPLRTGEIEAHCVPAALGYPAVIPKSIWWHRDFYFDANTGDVFQANPESEDLLKNWLVKRWIGAELRRGRGAAPEHSPEQASAPIGWFTAPPPDDRRNAAADRKSDVRMPSGLTTKQQAVCLAVISLWRKKYPVGLTSKHRDKQIIEWLQERNLSVPSPSTIKRYFQKMKRRRAKRPSHTVISH